MIQKNLKKLLESNKKDNSIMDIVLYGSFAKGKYNPEDIDILIIFTKGSLRERLEKIQLIKNKLKVKIEKKLDIKQILLKELFKIDYL